MPGAPGDQSVQPSPALMLARALEGAGKGRRPGEAPGPLLSSAMYHPDTSGVTQFDGQAGVKWACCPLQERNLRKKPGARGFRSLQRPTLAT